jgi:hypothetical protein
MARAARQADVMVPVIAGPTIQQGDKWVQHTIRSEWSTKISSVIITKRDLIAESIPLELSLIASKCEIPADRQGSILLCDTPEGMAAMQLQLLLDEIERKYIAKPISPEATAESDQRLQHETAKIIAGISDANGPLHRVSRREYQ